MVVVFFFQAEDGIRDKLVTGVQTCALPIFRARNCSVDGVKYPTLSTSVGTASFPSTGPQRYPFHSELSARCTPTAIYGLRRRISTASWYQGQTNSTDAESGMCVAASCSSARLTEWFIPMSSMRMSSSVCGGACAEARGGSERAAAARKHLARGLIAQPARATSYRYST